MEMTGQQVQAFVALWMLRVWGGRDDLALIDVGFPTYDDATHTSHVDVCVLLRPTIGPLRMTVRCTETN